jgi:hypothetical protein
MRSEPADHPPESEPTSELEDSERSRFEQLTKKLVQVPKKEIDEKAEEWKRERDRKR